MKINYKITTFVLLAIALSLLMTVVALAGNLDSPSEPSSSFSFTLEDIYNRLNEGTAGAQSAFTEPSSAPGSTMHTLNEIMEKAPAVDNTNGATADEILTDKTVWGLTSGEWGVITGTLPLGPQEDNTNGATADEVLTDKTVWGLTSGEWGVITGTLPLGPQEDNINGATADEVLTGKIVWGLTSGEWGVITGTLPLSPLPKTGQTTSYATGDDGDLQEGVTWPNPRFTDNQNGTLTDNLTGLVWLKNAHCSDMEDSWLEGLPYSNALYDGCTNCFGGTTDCGLSDGSKAGDWRLPNVNELFSLINFGETNSAEWLTDNGFENVKSDDWECYCSSTNVPDSVLDAFSVHLKNGLLIPNGINERCYALPVRDAQ